jgi:hypothetical protein
LELGQRFILPRVGNKGLGLRDPDAFKPGRQCDGWFVMLDFVMGGRRAGVRLLSGPTVPVSGLVRSLRAGPRLALPDQVHQIRFEALAVFRRMAEQQFDEPSLAGAEMPMDPAARQPVQQSDRLLDQEFFEFVRRHFNSQ